MFKQLSESFHKRIAHLRGEKIITLVEFSKRKKESPGSGS